MTALAGDAGLHAFLDALAIAFKAIAKLFLLGLIGFVPMKLGKITERQFKLAVRFAVDVFVPLTLVLALARSFTPAALTEGSIVILMAVFWIVGGALLTQIWFRFRPGESPAQDRAISAVVAIQNSMYLPIPMAMAVLPPELREQALVYIGLAIFATSPLQWTLGTYLVSDRRDEPAHWLETVKKSLSMPVLGVVAGVLLSMVPPVAAAAKNDPASPLLLREAFGVVRILSLLISPIAMILLGMMLASVDTKERIRKRHAGLAITVRLLVMPALVFLAMGLVEGVPPLVRFIVMLEAASPSAINLAIAAQRFGAQGALVSRLQLPIYACAIVTLPVWVAFELMHFPLP
ncbi:MAG: AEC family transporter [Candidatus Sumerlaeia bacterium]|nr:AEC family transporter [Candidatus Sumerlaeia bacterium]